MQFELDGNDHFFDSLLKLIISMHNAGIAHGDLKRKDNLMVDKNLNPYLIDFGTAVIKYEGSGFFKKMVFDFLKKTDLNAWIKHKYKRSYDRYLLEVQSPNLSFDEFVNARKQGYTWQY